MAAKKAKPAAKGKPPYPEGKAPPFMKKGAKKKPPPKKG